MVNSSGSRWTFWSNLISCDFVGDSDQHLSIKIQSQLLISPILLSFVHAKWTAEDRERLWLALMSDRSESLPYFSAGDINVIMAVGVCLLELGKVWI